MKRGRVAGMGEVARVVETRFAPWALGGAPPVWSPPAGGRAPGIVVLLGDDGSPGHWLALR